ncbi:MAG: hypothetical protein ABWZ57_02765 [Mesorhizobium sp.]|jgi:hypothetical protein
MSGKPEPREIIISDEKLFPDVQSLADREERQSAGGFILRATRNGKIVEYSATDASGVPLPGRYLRMADGAPHGAARQTCYYCVVVDGTPYCTEVLCPDPAIMKSAKPQ